MWLFILAYDAELSEVHFEASNYPDVFVEIDTGCWSVSDGCEVVGMVDGWYYWENVVVRLSDFWSVIQVVEVLLWS